MWQPDDPDHTAYQTWVRESWERSRMYGNGRPYPTFLTDEGASGVRAAYQDGWTRLIALKNRYDPTNVFKLNANIPPS